MSTEKELIAPLLINNEYTTEQLKHYVGIILELLLERGEMPISLDIALANVPNFGKSHPTYWGCALAGEAGEFANVTKKWERDGAEKAYLSLLGKGIPEDLFAYLDEEKRTVDYEKTILNIMEDETADVMIYCKVIADEYGFDLPRAIRRKLKIVKKRQAAKGSSL